MLKFILNSSLLFLMNIGMYLCLNFEAESETIKGNDLKLVCSVGQSSFTGQVISLLKDGGSKSTCDNANNCLPLSSDSGRYQYFSNATSVTIEISVANHLTDSGIWKCKLGLTEEQDYELVVKTKPGSTEFTQLIPESNNTVPVKNVMVSGRCNCIFPPPTTVELYYRMDTGAFQHPLEIPNSHISRLNETSLCLPYEFDVIVSNFTVENENIQVLKNVFFEMHFGDYKTSIEAGPFQFEDPVKEVDSESKKYLCAMLPGPLIFSLGFLAIIFVGGCCKTKLKRGSVETPLACFENKYCAYVCPMCTKPLKKYCCSSTERSKKTLLNSKERKIALLAVTALVTIATAGLLGWIIVETNEKCETSILWSITVGFALLLAFIFVLYPHFKSELSKTGSQGGETEDDNGDNKNNTGTRSTATKAPTGRTRESQNNTGSNTTKNATERVGLKSEH